jgi:membrane protein YqaA with SNARE-associated domain
MKDPREIKSMTIDKLAEEFINGNLNVEPIGDIAGSVISVLIGARLREISKRNKRVEYTYELAITNWIQKHTNAWLIIWILIAIQVGTFILVKTSP